MVTEIKATNWPVPAVCRECHEDILVCPVMDNNYVVPLVVDAWLPGVQWNEEEPGSFWAQISVHKVHVCDEKKVEEIRKARQEEDEEEES